MNYDEPIRYNFEKIKERNNKLQYAVIEDMENKRYIVTDMNNDMRYFIAPFVHFTVETLSNLLAGGKGDIYHTSFLESCRKAGYEFSEKEVEDNIDEKKEYIDKLIDIILQRDTFKSEDDCLLKAALVNTWKAYRYMHFDLWNEYIYLVECGSEADTLVSEYCFSEYLKNNSIFVYNDIQSIKIDEKWVSGNCWFTENFGFMFARDLYHTLVDCSNDVKIKKCSRCGHLFIAETNKHKYCPDCKATPNTIRVEQRKKSVRYLHKRVYDKLNNYDKYSYNGKKMLSDFLAESNYYWDIVRGKEIELNPMYSNKIKTEEQYRKWLEKKNAGL